MQRVQYFAPLVLLSQTSEGFCNQKVYVIGEALEDETLLEIRTPRVRENYVRELQGWFSELCRRF